MSESTPEPGESVPAWAQALQTQVTALAAKVAGLVPTTHAAAERRTEERLDRPTSVEEAAAREVARLRRIEKDEEERAASAKHRAESEARLAKLEQREKAPATPGGGGRQAAASGSGPDWRANLWG